MFMKPQVVYGWWWRVETEDGSTEWVDASIVGLQHVRTGDYTETDPIEVEREEGWGAQLSAPGYLDRTGWAVFATEDEAWEYLRETYDAGLCPVCGEGIEATDERTADGRLIGSCGDAFSDEAWEANPS